MHQNLPARNDSVVFKALIIAVALILLSVAGFYFLFPFLGIVIAMTVTAWLVIVGTVVFFSLVLLLFFVLPGAFVLFGSFAAAAWTILAILLFPFLFPIVIPILIILLFVAYLRKSRQK